MVSYIFPLVAVGLGIAVLDETLHWQLLAGGALILAGVAIFNRRAAQLRPPVTPP